MVFHDAIANSHFIGFAFAFIISVITVPLVRRYSIKKGFFDLPDERKIHQIPIPRVGGVAIWFSTIITMAALILCFWHYPHKNALSGIFAGGTIIFLLGLIDDLYGLSPKVKLVFQIIAASVAYAFGVQVLALHFPFIDLLVPIGWLGFPITVFWIVAISNAVNFIDGVDGLAGGVSVISALTLGVVAYYSNQPVGALVVAVLAGALLGFLLYNFHPAKIFMGDSGALFTGFILASVAVTGVLKTVTMTILLPLLILSVPLLDITYSVVRRLLRGQSPFIADGEHLHHKLLKAGISQNRTVIIFYLVCIATGTIATQFVNATRVYFVLLVVLLVIMLIVSKLASKKKFLNPNNQCLTMANQDLLTNVAFQEPACPDEPSDSPGGLIHR